MSDGLPARKKNDVIECDAVPMGTPPKKEQPQSTIDGRVLWLIVLLVAIVKVSLAIVVLIVLLVKFPRAMRLGILSMLSMKAYGKRKDR